MNDLKSIENISDVLILPQTIIMKWHPSNIQHYIQNGYKYTKTGNEFNVNILDLPQGSPKKIKCKCKYCNNVIEKQVKYISKNYNDICCNNCKSKKIINTNQQRYGVNSTGGLDWVKEKAKQTNLDKYGVEYTFQSDEIKQKIIDTNIEKLGVPYPMMSNEIREKSKKTCFKHYGVEYPLQLEEIKNIVTIKSMQTMYQNGTAPSTKQQKYIFNLLGGEDICKYNYPIGRCWLDIAFLEEMIYIEYDGGGHNKRVKCGWQSQEDFNDYEMKRQYYMKNRGWKVIRIISDKDKLLSDKQLLELINNGKEYLLNTEHTWYKINIDNMKLICSEFQKDI